MAVQFKSFEPKEGYEDLVLETHTDRVEERDKDGQVVLDSQGQPKFDRKEGAPLTISEWPFIARSTQEQDELARHPFLKQVSRAKAEAKVEDRAKEREER